MLLNRSRPNPQITGRGMKNAGPSQHFEKEQTLKEITQSLIKGKRLLIYLLRDENHFLVSVYSLWREQLMGSSVNGVSSTLIPS